MPRKVNRRRKKIYVSQIPREILITPPPLPPPSDPEWFIIKIFNKTNYFLTKHPYIICMIPLMYEFYNSYKTENIN